MMGRSIRPAWRGARRWRGGAIASEFALVLPIFALILFASTDIIRSFRAQLRIDMVAVQVAQIVSQCTVLTERDFTDSSFGFWAHARRIAGGIIDLNTGRMFVSVLGRDGNTNQVRWQQTTGTAAASSAFTVGMTNPPLKGKNGADFMVPTGQTLFVTEVFATIDPWVLSAGLIRAVLGHADNSAQIKGMAMFLSRVPDPASLLQTPASNNQRGCTA